MGREIRRVPPNYEHPRYTTETAPYPNRVGEFIPLHDRGYLEVLNEWIDNHQKWEAGTHPDRAKASERYWAQYDGNPPAPDDYRPDWGDTATWWCMYETVSEGTPVTPPFATPEELVNYLTTKGTFWDKVPWSWRTADAFMKVGWAPSFVMQGGVIAPGYTKAGELTTEVDQASARKGTT